MRAALFDPATPEKVRLFGLLIWEEPGGEHIAILCRPAGNMTGPDAIPAVLDQMGWPFSAEWQPKVISLLVGEEVPQEHRQAVTVCISRETLDGAEVMLLNP